MNLKQLDMIQSMECNTDKVGMQKKTVCSYKECHKRTVVVVGSCTYCKHDFCLKHRIPEAHTCSSMGVCKQRAFDRNSLELTNGKCVGLKL